MKVNEVRISIADLVWDAVNRDTGEIARIGVLSAKELSRGSRVYAPLGGASILKFDGLRTLVEMFEAHTFENNGTKNLMDLRCIIKAGDVQSVFSMFNTYRADLEQMHCHDVMYELKSLDLFTSSELGTFSLQYERTVRQGSVVNTDDMKTLPTHRLFRIYDLMMPDKLFQKLCRQKYIRVLSMDEVATTNGGTVRGVTSNGDGIQNNFF